MLVISSPSLLVCTYTNTTPPQTCRAASETHAEMKSPTTVASKAPEISHGLKWPGSSRWQKPCETNAEKIAWFGWVP